MDKIANQPKLKVYTDGSCIKNPGGQGTHAWAIIENDQVLHEYSSREEVTTNNRQEMMAVLTAMMYIRQEGITEPVLIHTDSSYTFNGCTNWVHGWHDKGYKRSGEDIPNRDLWEQLHHEITHQPHIRFKWVKGHVEGEKWNNYVDKLCEKAYGDTVVKPAPLKEKIFKSVIKLDHNFHVYVHGSSDNIVRGYDDQRGKNFITLYYDEEK